jgi:hypothetical protein
MLEPMMVVFIGLVVTLGILSFLVDDEDIQEMMQVHDGSK